MIDLMGKKYYLFALSGLIMLAGIIGYFTNGIQLDIQFQGGTRMQIEMPDNTFSTERAEEIVLNTINKTATVQKSSTFNAENEKDKLDLMVLNIASQSTLNDEERESVLEAMKKEFNIKEDAQVTVNSVAPFIGDEIKTKSIYAIFWSSIIIILYVWWRFRAIHGLSAGVFAVVALIHDVLVMFVVYLLFKIPLNDSFVAAVLTIIGYSMNDTIIIYDRIRENSKILRKVPVAELVNRSVVQSLARSINTSITTLLCIVTLYLFATYYNIQSVKDFTLPLTIGIISGVYSTIFIASPLYLLWQERGVRKKTMRKNVRA